MSFLAPLVEVVMADGKIFRYGNTAPDRCRLDPAKTFPVLLTAWGRVSNPAIDQFMHTLLDDRMAEKGPFVIHSVFETIRLMLI